MHALEPRARLARRLALALLVGGLLPGGVPTPTRAGDRLEIQSFTPGQREDLYNEMSTYITRAKILEHLDPPNDKHGSSRFLVWHRRYLRELEDYLISRGKPEFVPLPRWDPSTKIPDEFFLSGAAVDADCPTDVYLAHNCDPLTDQTPERFLPASLSSNLCDQLPFTSFRPTLEHGFHDGVHVQVGGAMAAFKSPAAPIFWLWHAFVDDVSYDWQCSCGNGEGNALDPYSVGERILDLAEGRADAWMRDAESDLAHEPDLEAGGILWESPDIWVRNTRATNLGGGIYSRFSNEHEHQNPEYASLPANRPWLYAKVRNRGCQSVSGDLHFYWANGSTGLTWPDDFNEVTGSPVPMNGLEPGRDEVAELQWSDIPMPSPTVGDHFCLLARFEANPSSVDPINGEMSGVSIDRNVEASNQIAWKNVTIVDEVANKASVLVKGASTPGEPLSLRFDVPGPQLGDSYFDHGTLEVDLGPLYAAWAAGGSQGQGITVSPMNTIFVAGPGSTIENVSLASGAQSLIDLTFGQVSAVCDNETTTLSVRLEEYEDDGATLVGGNTYRVNMGQIDPTAQVFIGIQGDTDGSALVNPAQRSCTGTPLALASSEVLPPGETVASRQWMLDGVPIPGATGATHIATETGDYALAVALSNGCTSQSERFSLEINTPPANDDACNAIEIPFGSTHSHSTFCATSEPGEVSPGIGSGDVSGCSSTNGWCAADPGVQNSVWFKFTAPENLPVSIQMAEHDHLNLQLALWDVQSCGDFGGYTLVGANDDGFHSGVWGTNPELANLENLVPGRVYYIQLDGFQGWQGEGSITVAPTFVRLPILSAGGRILVAFLLLGAAACGLWIRRATA